MNDNLPPDVAEKWVFWEKSDGYAVGPRNVGALAIVFTWDEAAALCAAANALLARLGQGWIPVGISWDGMLGRVLALSRDGHISIEEDGHIRMLWRTREPNEDCHFSHWMPLPPVPGASDE